MPKSILSKSLPFRGKYHALALSTITSFGSIFVGVWATGLNIGIGYYLPIFGVVSCAYFCYMCSLAELISAFPYSGGCFAFARCTLGYFPGFVVGCFQILYYILMVALINIELIDRLCNCAQQTSAGAIVGFGALLFSLQTFSCICDKIYWSQIIALSVFGVILLVCYGISALTVANYSKYAIVHETSAHAEGEDLGVYVGTAQEVFKALPKCLFFYFGIEIVCFQADAFKDVRKLLPNMQLISTVLTFIVVLSILLISVSSFPSISVFAVSGYDSKYLAFTTNNNNNAPEQPISNNSTASITTYYLPIVDSNTFVLTLMHVLKLNVFGATFLPVILMHGASMACVFAYGKITSAMVDSKLFPRLLKKNFFLKSITGIEKDPMNAIVIGNLLSFSISVVSAHRDKTHNQSIINESFDEPVSQYMSSSSSSSASISIEGLIENNDLNSVRTLLIEMIVISACVTMIAQLMGYIIFAVKIPHWPRTFVSPVGWIGAATALVILSLCFCIEMFVYSSNTSHWTPTVICSFAGFCAFYYCIFVQGRQRFSPEEKILMIPAHVEIKTANEYLSKHYSWMKYFSLLTNSRRRKSIRNNQIVPAVSDSDLNNNINNINRNLPNMNENNNININNNMNANHINIDANNYNNGNEELIRNHNNNDDRIVVGEIQHSQQQQQQQDQQSQYLRLIQQVHDQQHILSRNDESREIFPRNELTTNTVPIFVASLDVRYQRVQILRTPVANLSTGEAEIDQRPPNPPNSNALSDDVVAVVAQDDVQEFVHLSDISRSASAQRRSIASNASKMINGIVSLIDQSTASYRQAWSQAVSSGNGISSAIDPYAASAAYNPRPVYDLSDDTTGAGTGTGAGNELIHHLSDGINITELFRKVNSGMPWPRKWSAASGSQQGNGNNNTRNTDNGSNRPNNAQVNSHNSNGNSYSIVYSRSSASSLLGGSNATTNSRSLIAELKTAVSNSSAQQYRGISRVYQPSAQPQPNSDENQVMRFGPFSVAHCGEHLSDIEESSTLNNTTTNLFTITSHRVVEAAQAATTPT